MHYTCMPFEMSIPKSLNFTSRNGFTSHGLGEGARYKAK